MIPIPTRMGHLPSKANPFCVLFGRVSLELVYVYVSHTNESPHASRNKEGTICFDCLIRNTIPLSKISGLPAKSNSFCVLFGCVSRVSLCYSFTHKHKPTCFQEQRMPHLSLIVCVRVGGNKECTTCLWLYVFVWAGVSVSVCVWNMSVCVHVCVCVVRVCVCV
jgi:hypothetical protein